MIELCVCVIARLRGTWRSCWGRGQAVEVEFGIVHPLVHSIPFALPFLPQVFPLSI